MPGDYDVGSRGGVGYHGRKHFSGGKLSDDEPNWMSATTFKQPRQMLAPRASAAAQVIALQSGKMARAVQ
jgi:hypothetical protein